MGNEWARARYANVLSVCRNRAGETITLRKCALSATRCPRCRASLTQWALALAAACGGDASTTPLTSQGRGDSRPDRITAEVAVRGTRAYTTTWGNSAAAASVFHIWNVAGGAPRLVDSVRVDGAITLGDVAISDDGTLLVIATEGSNAGLAIYSIADPIRSGRSRSRATHLPTRAAACTPPSWGA